MKKLKTVFIMMITLSVLSAGMTVVSADTSTDLKTMKVYSVDAAGKKTEVSVDFSSTTYSYDLTVLSTAVSISIEATTADSTSTWSIEKDGINTKMDFGKNTTVVDVKSSTGVIKKYVLNTTKLTTAEEATYKAPETTTDTGADTTNKKKSDATVTVGKTEMKITSSFDKNKIPDGFKKSSSEYNGAKYTCIKGEVKDLTAFYLYNDDTEGFYIYNADKKEFYAMSNIKIKSRMYTIVNPEKTDGLLKNYDKKTVTIIDQDVKAWVLDEDEGMYLVYAMNWDGDTSLYCYDDNEKCFQRYIVSSDVNSQVEAANKAYENLQDKYNTLVDRYNVLVKVLCGLVIIIIVLIFVIINLSLNKKAKKIKDKNKKNNSEDLEENDLEQQKTVEESGEGSTILQKDSEEFAEEQEIPVQTEDVPQELETPQILDEVLTEELEEEELADITEEEPNVATQEEIEKNTEEAQHEAEEDLKETLKAMLPDEQDDDDDDDDFEFIDLN